MINKPLAFGKIRAQERRKGLSATKTSQPLMKLQNSSPNLHNWGNIRFYLDVALFLTKKLRCGGHDQNRSPFLILIQPMSYQLY